MRRMGRIAQFPAQVCISGGVLIFAVNVAQMLKQQGKRHLIDATTVGLDAIVGALPAVDPGSSPTWQTPMTGN